MRLRSLSQPLISTVQYTSRHPLLFASRKRPSVTHTVLGGRALDLSVQHLIHSKACIGPAEHSQPICTYCSQTPVTQPCGASRECCTLSPQRDRDHGQSTASICVKSCHMAPRLHSSYVVLSPRECACRRRSQERENVPCSHHWIRIENRVHIASCALRTRTLKRSVRCSTPTTSRLSLHDR